MGWKRVKEQYQISHIVHVTNEGICIGSSFITNAIIISMNGKIIKRYCDGHNEELMRYQREMDADPDLLEFMVKVPDRFEKHIPVFTHIKGQIVEKQCESVGWPNTTHDGELMYQNCFSPDLHTMVRLAEQHIAATTAHLKIRIADTEELLTELKGRLNANIDKQVTLQSQYSISLQEQ